jgi:titin
VAIYGVDAVDDVVQGNLIGTDVTGKMALGNAESGVFVGLWASSGAATGATIGGTAPGDGNVISANGNFGVWIYGNGANGNVVEGNKIGTDVTGTIDIDSNGNALGNSEDGVLIEDGANNTIGGSTATPGTGAGNQISGNIKGAVSIEGSDAVGDVVQGNLMGTNAAGTKGLHNGTDGVYVADGASDALIGGLTTTPGTGAGNVMADNAHYGIHITGQGTTGVVVEGNIIGLNAAGSAKLGNAYDGVLIDGGAFKNTIGGTATGAGNVLSGNHERGVEIDDAAQNLVEGNLIGTDVTGMKALGNDYSGVLISDKADYNTIGGTSAAARNVLSANGWRGVHIQEGSADNLVEGNDIGTDVDGTADLGNLYQGVLIDSGASSNTVGGTASGAGNLVAGNHTNGVALNGAGEHNLIEDDTINANGANNSKTNPGNGVYINDSSYSSVLGCTINNNPGWGILITSSGHVSQQKNSFSGNGKGNVSG